MRGKILVDCLDGYVGQVTDTWFNGAVFLQNANKPTRTVPAVSLCQCPDRSESTKMRVPENALAQLISASNPVPALLLHPAITNQRRQRATALRIRRKP